MKKLICNEVAKFQPALSLWKKNSLTHPTLCFLSSFSQNASRLLLSKRLGYLQFIYSIIIHLSQLSSCWILRLTFSWVQFLSNKLELFVSCNIKVTRTFFFLHFALICTFYKNLIVLHHGDNNFLFLHLHQFHTFNNNLNGEEIIRIHLMCYNFFMIKILQLLCYNFHVTTFLFLIIRQI